MGTRPGMEAWGESSTLEPQRLKPYLDDLLSACLKPGPFKSLPPLSVATQPQVVIQKPALASAKIRAAEFLAKIQAVELEDPAHLVKARAHALSNAVAQRFLPPRRPRRREVAVCSGRGPVFKIR